jgi:hypothetical protein
MSPLDELNEAINECMRKVAISGDLQRQGMDVKAASRLASKLCRMGTEASQRIEQMGNGGEGLTSRAQLRPYQ